MIHQNNPHGKQKQKYYYTYGYVEYTALTQVGKCIGHGYDRILPIMIDAAPLQTCCMARVAIMDGSPSLAITKPLTELTSIQ